MTDRQARIEQAVLECVEDHREEAIALLKAFVQRPSYSGAEGTAANPESMVGKVYQAALTHGTEVDVQPVGPTSENVIEVLRGDGDRALVLEAHTDIVPEGERDGWFDADPFSGADGFVTYLGNYQGNNLVDIEVGDHRARAAIRDQMARVWEEKRHDRRRPIIYGRGSFDNKGCVVPVMLAQQALAEALGALGERLAGSLIGAYTVDEETESTGIKRFCVGDDSWMATHGFLSGPTDNAGFLTEVSGIALDGSYGWVPVVGHRGSLQLAITVHGRAAHAATPHLGSNAVEHMGEILRALYEGQGEIVTRLMATMDSSLLGLPTLAIGTTIVGGGIHEVRSEQHGRQIDRGGVNSIPDWCEATVDIRFPNGPNYPLDIAGQYDHVLTVVQQYLSEHVSPDDWSYHVLPIPGSGSPPVALGRSLQDAVGIPIVRRVRTRAQQILGYTPDLEIAPGGTDATFMIHDARIPTLVEFGPAGGLSHNVHEFVERDDVIAGARMLALLAIDTLGLAQ